jgi:hypothetical protein
MSRTTGLLALFLAFNIVVAMALALPADDPIRHYQSVQLLFHPTLDSGLDSWGPMRKALDYMASPHHVPIYTELLQHQGIKFQYPLTALLYFAPCLYAADLLGIGDVPRFMSGVGWGFLAAMIAATALLLRRLTSCDEFVLKTTLVVLATLTFYPIAKGFTLGQVQIWIDAFFAMALLTWVLNWKATSGVLVGFMCLIKPQYALFLVWASLRREWSFVMGILAACLIGLGTSIAVFGLADNLNYLNAISFLSQHGEAYYPNQSVNGILNRIMGLWEPQLYNNLEWRENSFPPYTSFVYIATVLTSIAILGLAFFVSTKDRVIDFCIMAISITIASPIAWEHHYGLLLPIFVVAFATWANDAKALAWLAGSYVLTSNYWAITKALAATPLNFVQSYLFAGALMLLVLLYGRVVLLPIPLRIWGR